MFKGCSRLISRVHIADEADFQVLHKRTRALSKKESFERHLKNMTQQKQSTLSSVRLPVA